ncbi:MAG: STAS domain-containing protein [Thermoleophilaceae bacterium]|jgi:anti-anti-sigma factor
MSEQQVTVTTENQDGVVVAHVAGEIDLASAPRLSRELTAAIPNDATGVVIDLSGTTYLDSSGVSLVFELAERMQARQQQLRLALPDGAPLRRVLRVVNLESVVPIATTVEAAAADIKKVE